MADVWDKYKLSKLISYASGRKYYQLYIPIKLGLNLSIQEWKSLLEPGSISRTT